MRKNLYLPILASILLLLSACGKINDRPTGSIDENTQESITTESATSVEPATDGSTDGTSDTGTQDKEPIVPAISGGLSVVSGYLAGVGTDGKVILLKSSTADRLDTEAIGKWENLTQIIIGGHDRLSGRSAVGLKSDGTVYAAGYNLQGWSDIVQVAASDSEIIGLKKDGTVLSKGTAYADKNKWQDIVQVSAGHEFMVGLKKDKTVVAAGDNTYGQCEVSSWTDVELLSAGYNHVVGLRSDGTVLAAGVHFAGQCDVSEWTNIIFVAAGRDFTVGVKSDGTVVATGCNIEKRCAGTESWTDVAYVYAGENTVFGVTRDGKIMEAGYLNGITAAEVQNLALPVSAFDIDFSKKLASVEQKYTDIPVKAEAYGLDGEKAELCKPEEGMLRAGSFAVKVSDDIAEKIYYLSDENAIAVYQKADFEYYYDAKADCIVCMPARVCIIQAETDIAASVTNITPSWLIGDEKERREVNEYIHTVLKQVCELAGKEYTYGDVQYVGEDGSIRGSELWELYLEHKDRLTVESRVYYTFNPPTDFPNIYEENAGEYNVLQDYFRISAELFEVK